MRAWQVGTGAVAVRSFHNPIILQQDRQITLMKIVISHISAELDRNTDAFKEMDPYLIMEMGGIIRQTVQINSGGMLPYWPGKFVFQNPDSLVMILSVMDKDVQNDDLVAGGVANLSKIAQAGNQQQEVECRVEYLGKPAGTVRMKAQCVQEETTGEQKGPQ